MIRRGVPWRRGQEITLNAERGVRWRSGPWRSIGKPSSTRNGWRIMANPANLRPDADRMAIMPERPITVTMVAPTRVQCGIADYTGYLVDALRHHADVRPVIDSAEYR